MRAPDPGPARPGNTFLYEFFYTPCLYGSTQAPQLPEEEHGKAHPARIPAAGRTPHGDPHLRIRQRLHKGPKPCKAQPPPRDPSPEVIGYGSPSPHDPP